MKEILGAKNYLRQWQPSIEPDEDGTPVAGVCDQEARIIDINRGEICCKKDLLSVICHEEIHASFPEYGERETWNWTKALIKEITPKQKVIYFNLYDRNPTT